MKRTKRWAAGLLATAVMTAASVSYSFAASAEVPFGEFRIEASNKDNQEREISVDIYRRDDSGVFQADTKREYVCKLNRVTTRATTTSGADFFILAYLPDVWVSVDYLTDVNGDGVYELLDGADDPVWDLMDTQADPQDILVQLQPGSSAASLTVGQHYKLSPELLAYRYRQAVQDRVPGGSFPLDVGQAASSRQTFPLCMVKLHHTDPADLQDYVQTYYLQIYDDVLVPFDISPSDWYYDAVIFGLSQGYFSGTDKGLFCPESALTRAQLAQVLWTMSDSQETEGSCFSDVAQTDWFYSPVSWCQQEGLITGYSAERFGPNDLLTREQLVTVLHRYARYSGTSLRSTADLSRFADRDAVSSWALDSVRWAVTNGLISSFSETLAPQDNVSRADLAETLYAYTLNAGLSGPNYY